jgi:tetratricopeptide (TPR) repeat protein
MRRSRRLVLAVALLIALAPAVRQASAAGDRREVEARTLFFKGEYQRALDLYAAIYADSSHPVLLRNIGRCHQKLQQPDKAIEAFRGYLRLNDKAKPTDRDEVAGYIREMEALKAKQEQEQERAAAATAAGRPPPKSTEAKPPVSPARSGGSEQASLSSGSLALRQEEAREPASPAGADLAARPPGGGEDRGGTGASDQPRALTRQWWFWAGIGAAVVAGVAVALIVGRQDGTGDPPCPGGATCPTAPDPTTLNGAGLP